MIFRHFVSSGPADLIWSQVTSVPISSQARQLWTHLETRAKLSYNLHLDQEPISNSATWLTSQYSIIRRKPIHPSHNIHSKKKKHRQFNSRNPCNLHQHCHHEEIESYDPGSRRDKQHLGHLITSRLWIIIFSVLQRCNLQHMRAALIRIHQIRDTRCDTSKLFCL